MKNKGLLSSRMIDSENTAPRPKANKQKKLPTFYSNTIAELPKSDETNIVSKQEAKPQKEKRPKDKKAKYYIDDITKQSAPISQNTTTQSDNRPNRPEMVDDAEIKIKRQRFIKRVSIIARILLIVVSVYLCFLIYGLANTDFIYDENGKVAPEVLTVSDIRDLKEYEQIQAYYLRARIIYEDILRLEYKLSLNPESALQIAMDCTKELEVVDKYLTDINGAEYDSKYYKLYENMANWAKVDVALYLQYVSEALTSNDAEAEKNALTFRDNMYNDFASISKNTASLAIATKGAENIGIYEWSPESFIESISSN